MNLRKLVQIPPGVGAGAAAMGGLRPLQGAVSAVRRIADWATLTRAPFPALACNLFALRLRRDSTPAFGNSLMYGT
jgi:hypothetical protein